ncbi:MAG: hypothetical protein M1366_04940, partial [Patescibacteria group bacterium]|nr:hypothetical protein [Patescibacteria group bacterium]
FSLYLLLSLLHKWQLSTLFILFLTFCAGFLLKPVFIFLPFATLPILVFHFRNKMVYFSSLIFLILFTTLPVSYTSYNLKTYDYGGISHVSDINLLGKILQFDLPVTSGKSSDYFYKTVTDWHTHNGTSMPYRFLEHYDPNIYISGKWKLNSLPSFNMTVITHNLPLYFVDSFKQIPQALTDASDIIKPDVTSENQLSVFFSNLFMTYKDTQYVFLIIFLAYPLTFFLYLSKPNKKNTSLMLLGTLCAYQIILSVFFSYGEFGRLISVAQPILYCFSFYWLWKLTIGAVFTLLRKTSR